MSTCWTSCRRKQAGYLGSWSRSSSGHMNCSARLRSYCLQTPDQTSLNFLSITLLDWLFNSADWNCFLIPTSSSPVPILSPSAPPTVFPPFASLNLCLFHSSDLKPNEPIKQNAGWMFKGREPYLPEKQRLYICVPPSPPPINLTEFIHICCYCC